MAGILAQTGAARINTGPIGQSGPLALAAGRWFADKTEEKDV